MFEEHKENKELKEENARLKHLLESQKRPVATSPQPPRSLQSMIPNQTTPPPVPPFSMGLSNWAFGLPGAPPATTYLASQKPQFMTFEEWIAARPKVTVHLFPQVDQFIKSLPSLVQKLQQEMAESMNEWAQQWRQPL
jgi:CO dehydrogenase/acetyl-CoA synthase delta subunit